MSRLSYLVWQNLELNSNFNYKDEIIIHFEENLERSESFFLYHALWMFTANFFLRLKSLNLEKSRKDRFKTLIA